jgi:hypothetical protein
MTYLLTRARKEKEEVERKREGKEKREKERERKRKKERERKGRESPKDVSPQEPESNSESRKLLGKCSTWPPCCAWRSLFQLHSQGSNLLSGSTKPSNERCSRGTCLLARFKRSRTSSSLQTC